jgi:hypothetical protein
MKSSRFTETEALVESVVRGERIVVFPPGLWSVITVIMLLLVSTVILSGLLISIYGVNLEVDKKVYFQFLGLGVVFLFVIVPGLMVFRGQRKSSGVLRVYGWVLMAVGLFLVTISWAWPAFFGLLLASLAVYLSGTRWFLGCREYYALLKQHLKSGA